MTVPTFGMTVQRSGWTPRSEHFYNRLLVGLEEELLRQGHAMIVKLVADRDEERATFVRWAETGPVDAVVCKDITLDEGIEDELHRLGLRYAVLGDTHQPIAANAVLVDNAGALRAVLDHLRAAGHRRIDWLTGPASLWQTHSRELVFAEYVEAGLIDGAMSPADYDEDRCRELVRAAMGRERPPTAFVLDGGHLAVVSLEVLRRLGHSVPGDVSLVSWDDSLACLRAEPPVSALDHHVEDLGRGLARCLVDALAGRERREVGPTPNLVLRSST